MSGSLLILKKRSEFLACNKGRRQVTAGFVLQALDRQDDSDAIRVGFTCSKKIGNAVARNRAKRRLREVARIGLPASGQPGWDYVLIGRPGRTVHVDFAKMQSELDQALKGIHS